MSEETDFIEALFSTTEQPVEAEATEPEQAETVAEPTTDLRAQVGEAAGLPSILIDRLRGDNAEQLQADAASLAALLPEPEPPLDAAGEARLLAEQALAHAARTRALLANQPGFNDEEGGD